MEEKSSKMFWIILAVMIVLGAVGVLYLGTHNKTNTERRQEASQKADESKARLDAATKKYEDDKAKAE